MIQKQINGEKKKSRKARSWKKIFTMPETSTLKQGIIKSIHFLCVVEYL